MKKSSGYKERLKLQEKEEALLSLFFYNNVGIPAKSPIKDGAQVFKCIDNIHLLFMDWKLWDLVENSVVVESTNTTIHSL